MGFYPAGDCLSASSTVALHRKTRNDQRDADSAEIAREILKKSNDEVIQGSASGPFTSDELTRQLGRACIPSRRCGLRQGPQFDDFTESLLNKAVTRSEKVHTGGAHQGATRSDDVQVALASGATLRGGRQSDNNRITKLVGKCYDLHAAYNLCSLSDQDSCVIAVEKCVHGRKLDLLSKSRLTIRGCGQRLSLQPRRRRRQANRHQGEQAIQLETPKS